MTHDVIVVGARVAGAATAMLLARAGLQVLVVDRARFPSDTLSTHQVQVPGIARLHRWGLLDRIAAGAPATVRVRLDAGRAVLDGSYPRRAAQSTSDGPGRDAGGCGAGGRRRGAGGVRGRRPARGTATGWPASAAGPGAAARHVRDAGLVIGADGKRSSVAAAVGAGSYRVRPARTFACYSLLLRRAAAESARSTSGPGRRGAGVRHERRALDDLRLRPDRASSMRSAATSRATSGERSTAAATSASGYARGSGPSGSAPHRTSPTCSACRTGPAGRWSVTPVS